ncbi:MAG: amidohydrolase, partial [Sphingobacteriales bacterium]
MRTILLTTTLFLFAAAQAQTDYTKISALAEKMESKVIAWRRDIHANPELGNRENRTADVITKHLKALGMEVKTGIAHTGVVGILKGDKPGPVVALRADMDALPVTERANLPFASKVKTQYNGQEVGVMHACGHDTHVAILMGVAELLTGMKKDLKGTVKFIFQPAEEGVPFGEQGGAELMVKEGVLENPKVDAIFGLHINSQTEVGKIGYRPGGTMASVHDMRIVIKGRQAHGA